MAENITNVRLMYVPLNNEYKHTFYFKDSASQLSYFNNVSGAKSFSDFSYSPKDSKLRVSLSLDEAMKYNYVVYQNTQYSNKYFFAFIVNYEWKNENLTELTIETDVMQTWFEELIIQPSFIDREHTDDDTIGANTVPENLEIGEAKCYKYSSDPELINTHIVLGATVDVLGKNVQGGNYNGLYSGVRYYSTESRTGAEIINELLKLYASESIGKIDAVQCLFIAPAFLIADNDQALEVQYSNTIKAYQHTLTVDNTPYANIKNNKCLTFPYRYLLVSNNNGGSAIYKYEYFADKSKLNFSVQGVLTPGCSIRLIPKEYNNVGVNNEEGLNLGKYPICNWASDEYTNWLTQNSVNIGLNIATGVGQIIAGGAMVGATAGLGTVVGGSQIVGGIGAITGQLAQIHQMSFTPPQSHGNINCGDVITASETNTFHFYQMGAKPEYLKIVDEYFNVYGYKCNRIKKPNTNHRILWWYTKTIDCNATGNIPVNDLNKIKSCYNNGITFWKNTAYFMRYDLNNNII